MKPPIKRHHRLVEELLGLAARWVRNAAAFRSSPDASLYYDYVGTASGYYAAAALVAGVALDEWPKFPEWAKAREACAGSETSARFGARRSRSQTRVQRAAVNG